MHVIDCCPYCPLVMLVEHPEFMFFKKCPTCSFRKLNEEKFKKYPTLDKYTRYLDFLKNIPIKRPD